MVHTLHYSFKISQSVAVTFTTKTSLHFDILEKRWILKTGYNSKVSLCSTSRKNNWIYVKMPVFLGTVVSTHTFQPGHSGALELTNTAAFSRWGALHFLSCIITGNKHITKRLALVYSLKETIGFPEENRNLSALSEPEQLIVIQPPKTTLHTYEMFLFLFLLSTLCCLLH